MCRQVCTRFIEIEISYEFSGMKSALSVRSVLWNFPQKCSCNCLWWSECFLKELKSWRSQKVACNVYLIAIVEASLLLCIWRHIFWLICFSVYRNSRHSLLSPHIKSLMRRCPGSSLELRRKSDCLIWGFEWSLFPVLLKPLAAVSSLSLSRISNSGQPFSHTWIFFISESFSNHPLLVCFTHFCNLRLRWRILAVVLRFSAERLKDKL